MAVSRKSKGFSMKALIVLIILALVFAAVLWKMRKADAEAALAKRKSLERRKKQKQEALTQDMEMVWPVIIKPATGKDSSTKDTADEELAMTAIEFEPSRPGESKKAVG
jgi:hypothetical protein